jgi:hypothetical protein
MGRSLSGGDNVGLFSSFASYNLLETSILFIIISNRS